MNILSQIWPGRRREAVRKRLAGFRREPIRWGLTLIEILIATALMATLLVAMWRLVGIYTSLRDKGDMHAGRVGNVSVMMQQLEEDLRNMPIMRPQASTSMKTVVSGEEEAAPVESEAMAFAADYDDNPSVETLSESALELEHANRQAQASSQGKDQARSVNESSQPTEGPDTNDSSVDQTALQRTQPCQDRSEQACTKRQDSADGSATAACLVGDEQSLTLANLNCQVSRSMVEPAERLSPQLLAEHGTLQDSTDYQWSGGSGARASTPPQVEPERGVAVPMPVRFVRYWLAGMMPLMAQQTTGETERPKPQEIGAALGIGTTGTGATEDEADEVAGSQESEEEAAGLYREEVVGVSGDARMRPLRGQDPLDNLEIGSLSDYSNTSGTAGLGTSGLEPLAATENSEEVTRHSFHLAQVEWAKFRYFDGNRWKSSWDSRVQGELPVAIEMSLWLLRQGTQQAAASPGQQGPESASAAMSWTEVETMSAADSQFPLAKEPRQAGNTDAVSSSETGSSETDDNPMERQPEVRQLVVLRTAPLPADRLPGDAGPKTNSSRTPSTSALAPQREDRPTEPLP